MTANGHIDRYLLVSIFLDAACTSPLDITVSKYEI